MHIARPLAALSAATLAIACLGSASAAAAPADRGPRPAPRGAALTAPVADAGSIAEEQARRALAAHQATRGTTTFSVKSSRAKTKDVRAVAAALGADTSTGLSALGWTSVTVPSDQADATRARLAATPGVT
ncbi:MAG: hypothetical protein AB7V23_15300, partial [Candidatus Nanopelagicales bacterium]